MENNMSKFGKFDEKETKEGNIRRIVSKCLERMKHGNVRPCEDEKIEDMIKILSELLSEKEAKDLLSIANYSKILEKDEEAGFWELEDKFFELSEKTGDYEKFLKGFYYDVLPTVMTADFRRFGEVRNDFLRYFILWDNFAEKRRRTFSAEWIPEYSFEAAGKSAKERLEKFNNIKALYEFAAREIQFLSYDQPSIWCFYNVFRGLFNNIALFKALIEEKILSPKDVLDIFAFRPELFDYQEIHERADKDKFKFEVFDHKTKKQLAEILFSWGEMTACLADGDAFKSYECGMKNRDFYSLMMKLDYEYKIPLIRRVAEREVKKIEDLETACYFASRVAHVLVVKVSECCGEEAVGSDDVKKMLLEIFLRDKIVGKEWFKNLPELFQKIVIVEQARTIFNKAEIVVLPGLPETNIDKNALKKEVDDFLNELKKIAKLGEKPSAYYADEPFEAEGIPDPESYLTTLIFDAAVTFLRDSFGAWKAVKPVLSIFRNLTEQAYSIDMKPYEDSRFVWAFVPLRITPLLGSLENDEAAKVCEEWFKHLAGQLKSADDFAIEKRKENPEDVPEEFKAGYDINVIEPHPLWREAFCEAAGDLRVNSGCKSVFNHLKKNDIDKDVREAAEKTLERIGKIKGKFDSGSRKRALLNAWWWYRVAHLKSLGIDFDWVSAQNLKIKEVKINYPKN